MTTDQIITRDSLVLVRFGQHEIPVPDSLARILTDLITAGRPYIGTGSPIISPWLFPGGMPGQPITRPSSASACAPSASGQCPAAGPPSPTSPPSCPPRSSPIP